MFYGIFFGTIVENVDVITLGIGVSIRLPESHGLGVDSIRLPKSHGLGVDSITEYR